MIIIDEKQEEVDISGFPTQAGIVPRPLFGSTDEESQTIDLERSYVTGHAVSPENSVEALQEWNNPPNNKWRVAATFYSFFVFGMNDGAYGALVPYLEKYYNINYTVVSLVFLSPFAGYTLASLVNNATHVKFGQRGVAVVAPGCHLLSYIVFVFHPPYPVLVIFFAIVGFGNGLIDGAWCAWLGNMKKANQVSGVLQAFYALGATISPLIATAMFTKGGLPWYSFYYLMVASSFVELVTSASAFWAQTGHVYLLENPRDPSSDTGRARQALKNKLTWILALFVFAYVGAEVALGGWIVTFMIKERSASSFDSGVSSTGFWAGMTVGRLGLSFLTARLGEFQSVILYLSISAGLELIFWLVPSFVVSAIAVAFLGVFLGPVFPTAIVMTAKLLPRDLHVGTIGFATAFGGSGGAILPFLVGVIAQNRGVKNLQPVILALLIVMGMLWVWLPVVGSKKRSTSTEDVTRDNDSTQ
ncbi:MFS transporter-like protein [Bisporella sp. PMI_857]|nr:MFS transporter-like protein [Bisporella sp. PMI_857]